LKQNLIDGLSKEEFIKSKVLTVILFALASTVFIFIITLILGLCFSSYTELGIIFSDLEYLLGYFVKLIGFFSICLFLGILIKRSAFALGFLLVWYIGENIFYGTMRGNLFEKGSEMPDFIISFFPLSSLSNLVVEPFTRLSTVKSMGAQIGVDNIKDYGINAVPILIVVAWTVIFVLMSYVLLKKRDL
jgi:ABC-type transport system involved in multi-copper enzyme maturation permease subunit